MRRRWILALLVVPFALGLTGPVAAQNGTITEYEEHCDNGAIDLCVDTSGDEDTAIGGQSPIQPRLVELREIDRGVDPARGRAIAKPVQEGDGNRDCDDRENGLEPPSLGLHHDGKPGLPCDIIPERSKWHCQLCVVKAPSGPSVVYL